MGKLFFGFAMSDSMFSGSIRALRLELFACEAKEILERAGDSLVSCVNPSHVPTLKVAKEKFGLSFTVPEVAPKVELKPGDGLLVMTVQGLPRLNAGQHEYSQEQIEAAKFSFAVWTFSS